MSKDREKLARRLAEAARRYRDELGWTIVPVGAAKKPCLAWKGDIDAGLVNDLLENGVADGIAVVCGARSGGLVARDFDRPEGRGMWESANPAWAGRLPASISGSRRGHHLFAVAAGPTRTRFIPEERFGPLKGELRGDGAIAILPPSWHAGSRRHYRWLKTPFGGRIQVVESADIFLPKELARAATLLNPDSGHPSFLVVGAGHCGPPLPIGANPASLPPDTPETRRWIEACARAARPTRHGERNRCLMRFARLMLGRFPRGTPPAIREHLFDRWHRLAYTRVKTAGYAESLADFERAWRDAAAPHGAVLATLAAEAAADPWVFIERAAPVARRLFRGARFASRRWENANAAARAFRAVARHRGWGRFPLGCRELGRVAGLEKDAAARAARDLAEAGLVTLELKGRHDDEARSNSEWIYHGPRD
jgi:hypothetical protein